jgi:cytochrome c oxidase subunit 4
MESTENNSTHIIPYRTFLIVLVLLIVLALISVFLTQIYLGALTVAVVLFIAVFKSSLVLRYFMHLKFESRFFSALVTGVMLLIGTVICLTLLDYLYR